jgi:PKD repeat protein
VTINAIDKAVEVACAADGVAYAKYPDGNTGVPPSTILPRIRASGWGQEVVSADASPTITGPAPLAVFFDATGTLVESGADVYREHGFHWNFGYAAPSTPGTWVHSGKPKGNEVGRKPLAAHVYETPGTYTASLRVQNAVGTYSDAEVTIVVVDPDTYWTTGGRSTVVVPSSGPAPTWADNTRYQFARGSSYSALTFSALDGKSILLLEATGSGAEPVMPAITIESANITTRATWTNRITFKDLDMRAGLTVNKPCHHILQYRGMGRHTSWGASVAWYWGSAIGATRSAGWYYPRYITQYECDLDAARAAGSYAMSGIGSRWAILGCNLHESTYHNLRQFGFYKSVVAHNAAYASGSGYANLTNRSLGTDTTYDKWDAYDGTTTASRYLVAHDNAIGDSTDTFAGSAHTIQPQDSNHAEGIEDVIICDNAHARAAGGGLVVVARRVTEDANVYASVSVDTTQDTSVTPAEWFGPYYTDSAAANGVSIFAAPALIEPLKAGS